MSALTSAKTATASKPGTAGGVPLIPACAKGNTAAVLAYLAAGGDPAYCNPHGITGLMALGFPCPDPQPPSDAKATIVQPLVEAGANVDAVATWGQNPPNQTALHVAASTGMAQLVAALIDVGGAKVDVVDGKGQTPLLRATMDHHVNVVDVLLSRGADPSLANVDGCSPLIVLAEPMPEKSTAPVSVNPVTHIAEALLRAGATADAVDCNGLTALHAAALYGNVDLLTALLASAGANPNIRTVDEEQRTPLMLAMLSPAARPSPCSVSEPDQIAMVRLLAKAGASLSPSLVDAHGLNARTLGERAGRGHLGVLLELAKLREEVGEEEEEDLDLEDPIEDQMIEDQMIQLCAQREAENRRVGRNEDPDAVREII